MPEINAWISLRINKQRIKEAVEQRVNTVADCRLTSYQVCFR